MSDEIYHDSPTEQLLDHSYDGIQEYDNPLPGWWKFLFWITILFAPVYWFYFHFGPEERTIHGQYESRQNEIFTLRFAEIGDLEPDRKTIYQYMNEEKWLVIGKSVYKANCISCHGAEGEGNVGPNLTDGHWKNVRNLEDIAKVINDGAANGSMPAWRNRLSHQNQVVLTAAYIASLGKNPVSGKAPEGDPIGEWKKE